MPITTTTTKVPDANNNNNNNNNKCTRCQQQQQKSEMPIPPTTTKVPDANKTKWQKCHMPKFHQDQDWERPKTLPDISVKQIQIHTYRVKPQSRKMIPRLLQLLEHHSLCQCRAGVCSNLLASYNEALALP